MAEEPPKDDLQEKAPARRLSLHHATAKGMAEEFTRAKQALEKAVEELGDAKRENHLLRQRNRSLGRYLRLMYLVCFVFMICVIGQLFMVHYLMQ